MIFLKALWHTARVVCAGLYWLLFVCFVWAGLAQLGTAPSWGWACLAFVLVLFVARGYATRKLMSSGASYVAGCGAFLIFLIVAGFMTGYFNSAPPHP